MSGKVPWPKPILLGEVYARYRADHRWDHLRNQSSKLVPGFGPWSPKVFVAGEAPGAVENTREMPFCGAAGQATQSLLGEAGLFATDQEYLKANTWMTYLVKYRLPNNRTPNAVELVAGREYLRQEWTILGTPRVIVTLGAAAKLAVLHGDFPIRSGEDIQYGKPYSPDGRKGLTVWPMYSPALALSQVGLRPTVEAHWEELGQWLKSAGLLG